MLPFVIEKGELPFGLNDFIYLPGIRTAVQEKAEVITAYTVKEDGLHAFELRLGDLTEDERKIILDGCLINFYRN